MQFLLPAKPCSADAEVVVMVGCHQRIGGPFKLVYLFRRLRCLHIYEVVSQGREWWYSLHLTTDYRYCLRYLEPNASARRSQYPNWWLKAGGSPYPVGLGDCLMNDLECESNYPSLSVLIHRDQQHKHNLSGGRETFVPTRLLYGVVPESLLQNYQFWQDESTSPKDGQREHYMANSRNYKRLRGYPNKEDGEFFDYYRVLYTSNWGSHITNSVSSVIDIGGDEFVQCTGFPGCTVKIVKRPLALVKAEFKARSQIASHIESLKVLTLPSKRHQRKVARKENARKVSDGGGVDDQIDDVNEEEVGNNNANTTKFKLDEAVENDHEGSGSYWPCTIRRINDNGTYDLEFVGEYKWAGIVKGIEAEYIRKRGETDKKKKGVDTWHWDNLSDDEAEDWRTHSERGDDEEEDDEENETTMKKDRLAFVHFDQLDLLLTAAQNNIDVCLTAIDAIAQQGSLFFDVTDLANAVESIAGDQLSIGSYSDNDASAIVKPADSEDLVMLNLLYAPRSSRLNSILKVLTRIETAGHILAWTKVQNTKAQAKVSCLERGCPNIDLIELPNLKLAFTGRYDHAGNYRLYSVDHVDLFISNERSATYSKMLAGIPHSIILANVRGEAQILVPVIPLVRPHIGNEPFSTFLVQLRGGLEAQAERFFLYPVHVSFSFLLTKGVNSALYLMLLRLLHRDYADVFRLADSIATDTAFNKEGLIIYQNFSAANDDWHPDAHACRLKIPLVTIDASMSLPWNLTIESARHIVKLDSVRSVCRLSPREELQILECEYVVTSTQSPHYDATIYDEYSMALCFNRLHYLKAQVFNYSPRQGVEIPCTIPARSVSSNWPFYQDNSIFGERNQGLTEVHFIDDEGAHSWHYEMMSGDIQDAPEDGWLVVVLFHTLWSQDCIQAMPTIEELIPLYQDSVHFISVKADAVHLKEISKTYKISAFPTLVLLRGGKEVDRIVNADRLIDRLVQSINGQLRPDDKVARAKYRHRLRAEKALLEGKQIEEEEAQERTGEVEWTFDCDSCGENIKIDNEGLRVTFEEEDEFAGTTWEYTTDSKTWTPFSRIVIKAIETAYRSGKLYAARQLSFSEVEVKLGTPKISDYEITGFTGTLYAGKTAA